MSHYDIVAGLMSDDCTSDVGGFFDFVSDAVSTVAKGVTAVVKSGVTKTIAGGLAFVMPAVGVPLVASLAVANRALDLANGARGTPVQQQAMKKALAHTQALAKPSLAYPKGHPEAVRTVKLLEAAHHIRLVPLVPPKHAAHIMTGKLVDSRGMVHRGRFIPA